MPTREEEELSRQATALMAAGRTAEAERMWRQLLGKHHVTDAEYDDWLRGAAECYRVLKRFRECGLIYLYLHELDRARDYFQMLDARFELALCAELERRHLEAAQLYLAAERPVLAAISLERAGDDRAARAMWERVRADRRLRASAYERALCETNLGLCARRLGDAPAAQRHLIDAQRILEEVADEFESAGQRERACDCYQVLIELGKRTGSFENLSEGYLNCIRVLKQDNLRFLVLQYTEDFLALALEQGEYHAAALVAREAAAYAQRMGMPYERHYRARAGAIWEQSGARSVEVGAPPELAESALAGAIDCFASVGQFGRVGECYQRLAALPLPDKRRARYSDAAARYRGIAAREPDAPPLPDALRQPRAYADVWYSDLIEWELDGDYRAVCASLVCGLRHPDPFRRRALALLLLPAPRGDDLVQVAQRLGDLQVYIALRPLERLYERGEPRLRAAVQRALGQLFYKRSFSLLRRGLEDPEAQVRDAARESLRRLHWSTAFDSLVRIFRESRDERTRLTALESLGELGALEAGEFLLQVLRCEPDPYRKAAQRLLARFDHPEIGTVVRSYLENETGATRAALTEVWKQIRRGEV
jgi:hypothetical protein